MSNIALTNPGGGTPVDGIEFLRGNDAIAVPSNPSTHILDLIGDTVQGVHVTQTDTYEQTITVDDATTTQKGVVLLTTEQDVAQTIGAVTADVITIPLGLVAGTYQFTAMVKGFEAGTPAGCGYSVYGTFTTDGASATLVGNQDIFNENAALVDADAYFIASGNNAVLQVLGVLALTINWEARVDKL